MQTYKFGNKVKCIIRSTGASVLGGRKMEYTNQPYTILNNISAEVSFDAKNRTSQTDVSQVLAYHTDTIEEIRLSNCLLTNKVSALIFTENKSKLFSNSGNFEPDEESRIFLPLEPGTDAYQVFIYNTDQELVYAAGTVEGGVIQDENLIEGRSYLVVYSYLGKAGFSLDQSSTNGYVGIDLISEGNINEETSSYCLHIAKAVIQVDKSLSFRQSGLNTVDLVLKVIKPSKEEIENGEGNYLTII